MAIFYNASEDKPEKKLPYSAPAIVYEGLITARAGSVSPDPGFTLQEEEAGIGPVDLFGSNN